MNRFLIAAGLVYLTAFPMKSCAQPTPDAPRFGLETGLGVATSGVEQIPMLTLNGRGMRRSGALLLSLRGTYSTMILSDSFADAALLAGFTVGSDLGTASLSTGPALAVISRAAPSFSGGSALAPPFSLGSSNYRTMLRPGLAVAGHLRITRADPLGLILGVFGNLNEEEVFGGLALNVRAEL